MVAAGAVENESATGIVKNVGYAQTIVGVAGTALDIGLHLAHVLPGVGQVIAGVSIGIDAIKLGVELWECP